ncbi:MAG: hypothetical protein OXC00_09120 [Acidimicrobiaceae bacterium]|nr:hypothetical protein [Acidimicrobiaceae bacterium]
MSGAPGAIIDDDPEPALSVDDPEAVENGDGTPITFTLSLSEVSGRDVAVDYDTVDGSGTGGATAGDDYVAVSGATATIPAGSASVTGPVTLVDDDEEEEVERFRLQLSDPVNTRLDDASGSGTILDDDGRVQILAVDAAEAYEGVGASASFEVRLSRAAEETVTVAYATAPATATAGDDYTHVSGTLTFTAGQTARTVSVSLVDDDDPESTETFRLVLSGPSANAQLGTPRAVAMILDDDDLPKLSVADAAATEGAAAVFAVTLSRPSAPAVTARHAAQVGPPAPAGRPPPPASTSPRCRAR